MAGTRRTVTPPEWLTQTAQRNLLLRFNTGSISRDGFFFLPCCADGTRSIHVDAYEKPDNHVPVATRDTLPLFIRWPEARATSPSINPEHLNQLSDEINTARALANLVVYRHLLRFVVASVPKEEGNAELPPKSGRKSHREEVATKDTQTK